MNRRHLLGTLTTGFAALSVAGESLAVEDVKADGRDNEQPPHVKEMQNCLDTCTDCMNECNMAMHYCCEKTRHGTAKYLEALHLTVDCQEFCSQSAKMIGRVSPLMGIACKACAEACDACAGECEKHADDEQLSKCAKECHKCAASCRGMTAHLGHHAAAHRKDGQSR
jgi:hypothetical protein